MSMSMSKDNFISFVEKPLVLLAQPFGIFTAAGLIRVKSLRNPWVRA